jgi:thymidine kinase
MIKLTKGPMFAAKTTDTISNIRKYIVANKKCIIVKFKNDNRYQNENNNKESLTTHDNIDFKDCTILYCKLIAEIIDKLREYDVIAINEAQFYDDLVSNCLELKKIKKIILLDGLNGDFKQEPFKVIADIEPHCEIVKLKKAICEECKKEAIYSQRIVECSDTILIGGKESYIPVCFDCLIKDSQY